MNNTVVQKVVNGKIFNILGLPNTGVFKLDIYNPVGSGIETLFKEKTGKTIYGASHLMEHLSFKSPRDYSSHELLKLLKENGTRNAETGYNSINFHFLTTVKHIDIAIKTVLNITYNDLTRISVDEFESERNVVINEVNRYHDDSQLMFSLNSYGLLTNDENNNILGSEQVLSELTISDMIELKALFNAHDDKYFNIIYDPVVSDIDYIVNEIVKQAEEFEAIVIKPTTDIDICSYANTPNSITSDKFIKSEDESKQSIIKIYIDVNTTTFGMHAGNMFTKELSNENSMFNIIRDKHGLTYGVSYDLYRFKRGYGVMFSVDVTTGNEELAIKLFKEIVTSMPDLYTKEAHKSVMKTILLKDTLSNLNLKNTASIFTDMINSKSEFDRYKDIVADNSNNWMKAEIEYNGSYELVKTYLTNIADKVKAGEYITITN